MMKHVLLCLFLMILLAGIARGSPVTFEFSPLNAEFSDLGREEYEDGEMSSSATVLRANIELWMIPKSPYAAILDESTLKSNQFRVQAEASADGDGGGVFGAGWTEDGDVSFPFKWTVPYTYSRQVTIDQSGPVAMATFPVVKRAFKVDAALKVVADENGNYTSTYAGTGDLIAGGTGLAPRTVQTGVRVGPQADYFEQIYRDDKSVVMRRTNWNAPSIGDNFSLTQDPSTYQLIQFSDENSVPNFFIKTELFAASWGSSQGEGPWGAIYGGGEALSCYGRESSLSSFSASCFGEGITVTGLFSVDSYVTVAVEYLGSEQNQQFWRVLPIPPVPGSGDDFDDAIKDSAKWGTDEVRGGGQLNETNGRLEYTCGSGTRVCSSDRPWKLTQFPYDTPWGIMIDATNTTSPAGDRWSSFGIVVENAKDGDDWIEVELTASQQAYMFWAEFHDNHTYIGDAFASTMSTSAPIRISFDNVTKVFTVSYFDGTWNSFGTFGVNGSGGFNGNATWGMTDSDHFVAYVFGYSENMTVNDGEMYGDNFKETGGVEPPRPEITSPADGFIFDTCSYFAPPLFQWSLPLAFQKLELQFYTSTNPARPIKVKVKDPTATQLQMTQSIWKKILKLPGFSGGELNWKIVGMNKGQPAVESDVFTMIVAAPQPVETPAITLTRQTDLPTLAWGNACATKFKVYFSPDDTFKRKKTLTFNDKNPLDNGEYFSTTLVKGTWNAIRKLVYDEAGSTIHWYVESWDALKRYQKTGDMQFRLEP